MQTNQRQALHCNTDLEEADQTTKARKISLSDFLRGRRCSHFERFARISRTQSLLSWLSYAFGFTLGRRWRSKKKESAGFPKTTTSFRCSAWHGRNFHVNVMLNVAVFDLRLDAEVQKIESGSGRNKQAAFHLCACLRCHAYICTYKSIQPLLRFISERERKKKGPQSLPFCFRRDLSSLSRRAN